MYSLPSLELVHESPLSGCLSWYWDVPPGHARKLGRLAATSRLGQLQLLGLGNELLQMGVLAGEAGAGHGRERAEGREGGRLGRGRGPGGVAGRGEVGRELQGAKRVRGGAIVAEAGRHFV